MLADATRAGRGTPLMTQRPWVEWSMLAGVASVVHGLLLVDPHTYFDDWFLYTYVSTHDWDLLSAVSRDRGIVPIERHYWWMFRDLPVVAFRAVVFVMIVASAGLAMSFVTAAFEAA